MKKLMLAITFLMCASQNAFAEDCDIRASLVDLRDKGIAFGIANRAFLADTNAPQGDPCRVIARSTGISNPRSSIFRDYPARTTGQNTFKRTFSISNPVLLGQGSLSFAKMMFNTAAGEYHLNLLISPGAPISKGTSPSYLLSGTLDTLNQAGVVTNSRQAFNPQYVVNGNDFQIVWKSGTRPLPYTWVYTKTLEVNFGGNNTQNIIDYDLLNSQYTGEFDFQPKAELVGVLQESGLQPGQLTFTLGGISLYSQQ